MPTMKYNADNALLAPIPENYFFWLFYVNFFSHFRARSGLFGLPLFSSLFIIISLLSKKKKI